MILNHRYEGATVGVMDQVILYGSVRDYSNFKRAGEECDKDIKGAEIELICIFEEIKREKSGIKTA